MMYRFNKTLALGALVLCLALSGALFFVNDSRADSDTTRLNWFRSSAAAKYHYSLGVLFSLDGNPDAAIREFRRALRFDSRSDFLVTELAMLYLGKGEKERASDLCLEYLQQFPDNIPVRLTLAGLRRRMNDIAGAISEYLRVISLDPDNIHALFNLGIAYHDSGDLKSAQGMYEKVISIKEDHVAASFYLARIHLATENHQEAENWLNRTLALNPSFEQALLELSSLYEKLRRPDSAISLYLQYLKLYPESLRVRLMLVEIYLRERRYGEAEEELKKAAMIDDQDRELRFLTGILNYERGDYQEAYEILKIYLQDFPADLRARYIFATLAANLRRHEEALEEYRKITPDAQMYANARMQMGLILERLGNLKQAIQLVAGAIEQKKQPILYMFLASLYEKANDPGLAEEMLKKGVAEFPRNVDLYYGLGVFYDKANRPEQALEQMRSILRLEPDNAEALNFIGYSWADRGINLDEAEQMIKRALELNPKGAHIIDSLGWVYFRQGKNDLAIKYLTEALNGLPDDPTVAEHLGDALEKDGRLSEALEMYRRALKSNSDSIGLKKKIADILQRL